MVNKFKPKTYAVEDLQDRLSERMVESNTESISDYQIRNSPDQKKIKLSKSKFSPYKKPSKRSAQNKNISKSKKSKKTLQIENKENLSKNPDDKNNNSLSYIRKQRKWQNRPSILKLPFQRLIRQTARDVSNNFNSRFVDKQDYRYTKKAVEVLHRVAETYLLEIIEDSYCCSKHAKRVTLMLRDLYLARRIRGTKQFFYKEIEKVQILNY